MQLKCNTDYFRQLKKGQLYECHPCGGINGVDMVDVELQYGKTQRFSLEHFVESSEAPATLQEEIVNST